MPSFLLQKTSDITGVIHTREIPMDELVFESCFEAWQHGALIQDAFPMLSADDREYIKTGITPEEWDDCMGEQ